MTATSNQELWLAVERISHCAVINPDTSLRPAAEKMSWAVTRRVVTECVTTRQASQNSWRVTVGSLSTSVRFVRIPSHHAPGSTRAKPPQKKPIPNIYDSTSKRPAGPWFPMSGNALRRCLEKQIAGAVTLLIRTRWHGPIHLCLLFDVLERAEHRDGLFHWHLVWWIKHQRGFGDWIFEYKSRNSYGSQDTPLHSAEKVF